MYNTNTVLNQSAEHKITMNSILEKVTDYDIFSKYIGDFKIGYIYNSPLREDNNPSFGVFVSRKTGDLLYKDLASDDCGNVFKFVKRLKNLKTYEETLKVISEDMNINGLKLMLSSENKQRLIKDTIINVVRKPLNLTDIKFWNSFGISKETLKTYNVSPISKFLINGIVKGTYEIESPLYCYKVFNKFKIYKPFGSKMIKWRGNLNALDIQGFEQLPEKGELLIITKSLKDVMVLSEMGYDAIAPSSESTMIPEIVMNNLKRRFKRIILFYDRDRAGLEFARKLVKKFGLDFFFINKKYKTKDISDLVKGSGYAKALSIFNEMVN